MAVTHMTEQYLPTILEEGPGFGSESQSCVIFQPISPEPQRELRHRFCVRALYLRLLRDLLRILL